MRCEKCQGTGQRSVNILSQWTGEWRTEIEPCPDCQGIGISYCCDEAGANPPNVHKEQKRDGSGQ